MTPTPVLRSDPPEDTALHSCRFVFIRGSTDFSRVTGQPRATSWENGIPRSQPERAVTGQPRATSWENGIPRSQPERAVTGQPRATPWENGIPSSQPERAVTGQPRATPWENGIPRSQPERAVTGQPRATPWENGIPRMLALKGRYMLLIYMMLCLFRAIRGLGAVILPRRAPWAGLYSPIRRFYVLSNGCSLSISRYENGDTRRIGMLTGLVSLTSLVSFQRSKSCQPKSIRTLVTPAQILVTSRKKHRKGGRSCLPVGFDQLVVNTPGFGIQFRVLLSNFLTSWTLWTKWTSPER